MISHDRPKEEENDVVHRLDLDRAGVHAATWITIVDAQLRHLLETKVHVDTRILIVLVESENECPNHRTETTIANVAVVRGEACKPLY